MAEIKKIPQIRFQEFSSEWERSKAEDIFETIDDRRHPELPVLAASQELGMVQRSKINYDISYDKKNEITYKRVMPGQFVIHLRSFQGGFAHSDTEGITSPAYAVMDFKEDGRHDDYYWKYLFSSDAFIKRLETVTYGIRDGRSISYDDFKELDFEFPSNHEQKRIGKMLKRFQLLIAREKKKHDQIQKLKKIMLKKMFPNNDMYMPEIRLGDFSDKWEKHKLSDYLEVSKEKNIQLFFSKEDVLSVSDEFGIVNQMKHKGRSYAGVSMKNYGVVYTNDIVYTKSPLKEAPYGIIKSNKGSAGIVSALYAVYHPKECSCSLFVQYYFGLDERLNQYLQPLINKGAKNAMNVSDEAVLSGSVIFPCYEEQKRIADYFDRLESFIFFQKQRLEKLQCIKKALLEKMFI